MKLVKFLIMGLILLFSGCTIRVPDIKLVGEKTTYQKQVVGEFEEIDSEYWVIASSRAFENVGSTDLSEQKQRSMQALKNQSFNADDIAEIKSLQVVGENNSGMLEILPHKKYQDDEAFKQWVDQLVAEENKDRKIIFERITTVNEYRRQMSEEEILAFFARMMQEDSIAGTMLQTPAGEWIEKSDG